MRMASLVLVFALVISVASCDNFSIGVTEPGVYQFAPGECLSGEGLILTDGNPCCVGVSLHTYGLNLKYDKNADKFYSHLDNVILEEFPSEIRGAINSAYESYCENLFSDVKQNALYLAPIFLNGNITMTADKSFGGREAGEDISDLFELDSTVRWDEAHGLNFVDDCSNKSLLSTGFICKILNPDNYQIELNDKVNITVSIPVKIGMFLHWIAEKQTYSNAEMQFREGTLTGTTVLTWNVYPKGH